MVLTDNLPAATRDGTAICQARRLSRFVRPHSTLRFTGGACGDRRWIAVLLVAAGVFLAACGDGGATTSTAMRTPGVVATPTPAGVSPTFTSTGCAPARSHDSGSFTATLTSAGLDREYILYVPRSYTGEHATPLVVNLHGHGSSAAEQAIYSGLPVKAEEDGFIVVTPQGTEVFERGSNCDRTVVTYKIEEVPE